jgi:hypothetical protein
MYGFLAGILLLTSEDRLVGIRWEYSSCAKLSDYRPFKKPGFKDWFDSPEVGPGRENVVEFAINGSARAFAYPWPAHRAKICQKRSSCFCSAAVVA